MYWVNPNKPEKIHLSGIESVRRDNCQLVGKVITRVIQMLMGVDAQMNLTRRDPDEAVRYVKHVVSDLLCGRVDFADLVISKTYKKDGDAYKAKQAHVELIKRMKLRHAPVVPLIGDRVPYVIIQGMKKGGKVFEQSEDPMYALEHNLPLDAQYYIQNQLKKPLGRIFSPLLGGEDQAHKVLFTGVHTRRVVKPTSTAGIGRFLTVQPSCFSCHVPGKWACDACRQSERGHIAYDELRTRQRDAERERDELWEQCRICQEDVVGGDPEACSNQDCHIFYRRTMRRKEARSLQEKMHRISW